MSACPRPSVPRPPVRKECFCEREHQQARNARRHARGRRGRSAHGRRGPSRGRGPEESRAEGLSQRALLHRGQAGRGKGQGRLLRTDGLPPLPHPARPEDRRVLGPRLRPGQVHRGGHGRHLLRQPQGRQLPAPRHLAAARPDDPRALPHQDGHGAGQDGVLARAPRLGLLLCRGRAHPRRGPAHLAEPQEVRQGPQRGLQASRWGRHPASPRSTPLHEGRPPRRHRHRGRHLPRQ